MNLDINTVDSVKEVRLYQFSKKSFVCFRVGDELKLMLNCNIYAGDSL